MLSSVVSVVVLTQSGAASASTSSFARWIVTHTGNFPRTVAVADFNGDGDLDVATTGNQVVVLLGTGDGEFDTRADYDVAPYYTDSIAVGDFDADGSPDLVVSSTDGNEVWVLLGSPDGTFGDPTAFGAGERPSSIAVGDLNHDGDLDLAVTTSLPGDGTVSILLGGSGGTFGAATAFPAGQYPLSVLISDFDGDSDPDLAVSNGGTLSVLLGGGDGSFDPPSSRDVGSLTGNFSAIAAGNFNGDSDPDLAVVGDDVGIAILLGGAGGTFAPAETVAPAGGYDTSRVLGIDVGDFNSDSHADLALASPDSGFAVLHGDGDGTFRDLKSFSTNGSPVAVAVGDFNADHQPDAVVANQQSADSSFGDVAVLLNTLDTTPPDTTITGGPTGLTNQNTPTFSFTSSEPGSTFECRRVVDESFVPCTSPWQFPDRVDDGPHTFQVRATDASGNVDTTPASRDYDVDTLADLAVITAGPSGPTNDTTPTFEFRALEAGSTFRCRVDSAAFAACVSPFTTAELADGEHTMNVLAVDSIGNVRPDSEAAARTFTVDTVGPDTTITGGPAAVSTDTSPTFTFTSPEPGVTFECDIDTGRYDFSCSSPYTNPFVGDGSHTFKVRAIDAAGNVDPTPASQAFTIDRSPPDTYISTPSVLVTGDNTLTFEFTSDKSASTFECRVDEEAFAACTSPHTTAPLADGRHSFEVRATDSLGNVDPEPALRTFTVDTVAPDTAIFDGPSGLTNDNTPSFDWESDASRYECRVDDAPFAECAEPFTTAPLSDGEHTFELRAIDAVGNTDPTPARLTFTVDTTARVTTITGGPIGLTNEPHPQFTFATADPDSTFECRLLAQWSFEPCTSPYTSPNVVDGEYTFQVRSTDPAGNVESPAVGRTFTIDRAAPDTTITDGPTGTIHEGTPTFGFGSSESGATLECRVDAAAFEPCASPYTTAPLGNGSHTFEARATDAAGNTDATPASRTFTVSLDTTAPETTIDSGPGDLTNHVDATFTFSADEPATYECKLDTGAYASCHSGDTFGPLGSGSHTFAVRATDQAGNVEPVPATWSWIVDTTPPQTTLISGPPSLSLSSRATFVFTSSEGGSLFECRLDGGTWEACASPRTYTGVRAGNHTFSVRAIDPAGNTDPTPAEATWWTLGLLPF